MREIQALDDFEHLLLRPQMYVGSVKQTDDKIIVFDEESKVLKTKVKKMSEGFYRIFDEVLDNAFDEGKRCFKENFKFEKITVHVDSKLNKITVTDYGRGFVNGTDINSKTGLTNIETALTKLKAGSNFNNSEFEVSTIGMNGIGVSATNMLSDYFSIKTQNDVKEFTKEWNKFVSTNETIKTQNSKTFTEITFIPRKDIFPNIKWDYEILLTKMILKYFLITQDEQLKNTKLEFYWDGKKINIDVNFAPNGYVTLPLNKRAICLLWEAVDETYSKISFVNSSQCSGFHQTYFEEYINKSIFNFENADWFYRSLIILNLKPKDVQFKEQNKVRFDTNRFQMENLVPLKLKGTDIKKIQETDFYKNISLRIENYKKNNDLKKLKSKVKKNKIIISDKFFPSKHKKNFYICEGLSALGSLNQKRDPLYDAIYGIRGKIKNVHSISELTSNPVIVEIISILGLNLEDKGEKCNYEKIIIASDADCIDENQLILTKDGYKKISEIPLQDEVMGSDGIYHKVINLIESHKEKYVEIEVAGQLIKCSENHKFIVYREGKIQEVLAKNIKKTDKFLLKNKVTENLKPQLELDLNEYHLVSYTSIKKVKKEITLYDIEVEGIHNFYIKTEYGDLLSHNCDGTHIAALLINLFHTWFPKLLDAGKVYKFELPIMSYEEDKKVKYVYDQKDFKHSDKMKNIRYLKGLGSISTNEWSDLFKNQILTKYVPDSHSVKFMTMAFGNNAKLRKSWLEK